MSAVHRLLAVFAISAFTTFARSAHADEREDLVREERVRAELAAQKKALAELAAKVDAQPENRFIGYVHADWTVFRQSSQDEVTPAGEPINENRFVIRRARFGMETDRGLYHAQIMLDANTNQGLQVRPWIAELSVKWPEATKMASPAILASRAPGDGDGPWFIVTTGLLITPFGHDVAELELARPFLERTTFANALVPQSYDLGLRILGGYKVLNWAFAVVNGDPIGEKTFPGRDPNQSKDLVFRVGAASEATSFLRASFGASGLSGRGFHRGTPATKDQLVWRDENEDGLVTVNELRNAAGSSATPSQNFSRFALGADLRVEADLPTLGTLTVQAEVVRAKNVDRGLVVADPVASGRDLRELGWSLSVTQEITHWLLAGVRHDVYDPDADANEQRPFAVVPKDSSFRTWSFMTTFRYKTVKLVAQYDLRANALGRDESGAPATLADDAFTLRAAVGF